MLKEILDYKFSNDFKSLTCEFVSLKRLIDYEFTSSFLAFIMSQNMNKKRKKINNYIEKDLFDSSLKKLQKKCQHLLVERYNRFR